MKYPCLKPIAVQCSCGCGQTIYRDKYMLKRFPKPYVSGHQFRGELNTNWNNGQYITSKRLVYLKKPEHPNSDKRGYIRRSVFVMSQQLNRPIKDNELVHHINGNPSDDSIENLVIISRQKHASIHHKGLIKPNSLKNLKPRHIKRVLP